MRSAHLRLLAAAVAFSAAAAIVCARVGAGEPAPVEARVFPWSGGSVSGIAFDGDALWITRDGAPLIHRVDPETGAVTRTIPFVTGDTGGSAWDGRTLWQIAYLARTVYAVDLERGTATPAFATPGAGLCAGMTFDGRYLRIANFEEALIYRVDPASGAVVDAIAGNFETTGLAWDGRFLWTGILVGTKTHDEETPYTGFVQQLTAGSPAPRRVWPVPGVGPGASDWVPGRSAATRFWWYDGYHERLLEMRPREMPWRAAAILAALAALAAAAGLATAWPASTPAPRRASIPAARAEAVP